MDFLSNIFSSVVDYGGDFLGSIFGGSEADAAGPSFGYDAARDTVLGGDVEGPIRYDVDESLSKPTLGTSKPSFLDRIFTTENVLSGIGALGSAYTAKDEAKAQQQAAAANFEKEKELLALQQKYAMERLAAELAAKSGGGGSQWNPARDRYLGRMDALKTTMGQRATDSQALASAYQSIASMLGGRR